MGGFSLSLSVNAPEVCPLVDHNDNDNFGKVSNDLQ